MVNLNKTMSLCQVIRHSGRGDIMSRIEKRFQVTRRDEIVGRIKLPSVSWLIKEYDIIPQLLSNNNYSGDTIIKIVADDNETYNINGSRIINGVRISAAYEGNTDILNVSVESV